MDSWIKPGKRREFTLMLLSNKGRYPKFRIRSGDALYSSEPGLIYTVVPTENPNEYGYSETAWANLAEIRWWGALAFSLREGNGFYVFHPHYNKGLYTEHLNERLAHDVAQRLLEQHPFHAKDDDAMHWIKPDANEVHRLYSALRSADNVLLRGVSCFLKSHLLQREYLFLEEAGIDLYISLEAALAVLRKRLSGTAGRDISYRATLEFLGSTLTYGAALVEFFEDCRDDRNSIIHPDNGFGPHALLPMSADDILELFGPMVSLYRYILIGDQRPSGRL